MSMQGQVRRKDLFAVRGKNSSFLVFAKRGDRICFFKFCRTGSATWKRAVGSAVATRLARGQTSVTPSPASVTANQASTASLATSASSTFMGSHPMDAMVSF